LFYWAIFADLGFLVLLSLCYLFLSQPFVERENE
jgi:hypothetical protein